MKTHSRIGGLNKTTISHERFDHIKQDVESISFAIGQLEDALIAMIGDQADAPTERLIICALKRINDAKNIVDDLLP